MATYLEHHNIRNKKKKNYNAEAMNWHTNLNSKI